MVYEKNSNNLNFTHIRPDVSYGSLRAGYDQPGRDLLNKFPTKYLNSRLYGFGE